VVALGDSVTEGLGDAVPDGYVPGWAGHLAVLLGGPPTVVLASRGAQVHEVARTQLPVAASLDADIATLLVGGNDIIRLGLDVDALAASVRVICEKLGRTYQVVPARTSRRLNAAIIAATEGLTAVLVVDPAALGDLSRRSLWHSDRMHPSPAGHRLLARVVADLLAERGFPSSGAMPPDLRSESSRWDEARWAVRTGVPWVMRRALNLIPEIVAVVVTERHSASSASGPSRRG
jgi:lysophospholipase L1-like esterase